MRSEDWIGRIGRIPPLLLGFLLLAASSRAAVSDWRYLPIWGGDVRTVAVDPANPDVAFAGTASGQVYLSQNGGPPSAKTGPPLPLPSLAVGNVLFCPYPP